MNSISDANTKKLVNTLLILRGQLCRNTGNKMILERTKGLPAETTTLSIRGVKSASIRSEMIFKDTVMDIIIRQPEAIDIAGLGRYKISRAAGIAIVSGAGSSNGTSLCRRLINEGFLVSATDISMRKRHSLEMSLHKESRSALSNLFMDVTDELSIRNAIAKTVIRWGGLDRFYFCVSDLPEKASNDTIRKFIRINTEGAWLCRKHALFTFQRQGITGDMDILDSDSKPSLADPILRFIGRLT